MVAKSYQNLEIVGEVFVVNGRNYVNVRLASGNLKQVRWYSDKEYTRLYGEVKSENKISKTQKEVLGFKEGYITIFKGDTYAAKEELKAAGARYTKLWGWGIAGGEVVPEIAGIEPVRLDWENVGVGEELLPDATVEQFVASLVYEPSKSEFQGAVGERLHGIFVKVIRNFKLDGYYGQSVAHDFEDENGNIYTWITTSKDLPEGNVYWLDGTVKDHKTFKNVNKTVLSRCKVVEEC